MIFIETTIFTKRLGDYLEGEEYCKLQNFLMDHPDTGKLMPGTGGFRKLRWGIGGKGKRGGIRIIYYWQVTEEQIYLMTLYAKNEMVELTSKDKKMLKQLLQEW